MTSALQVGLVTTGLATLALAWWVARLRAALRRSGHEIARLQGVALRRADQVSVLSHEVRTPLALIKGSADLLAEETPGPLTRTQAKFVDTISGSADHVIEPRRGHAGPRPDRGRALRGPPAPGRACGPTCARSSRSLRQVHRHRAIALDAPGPPTRVHLDPQAHPPGS